MRLASMRGPVSRAISPSVSGGRVCFRFIAGGVRLVGAVDRLPALHERNAAHCAEFDAIAWRRGHAQGDGRLTVFVVRHDRGEIRPAYYGEQPLFVVAEPRQPLL